jgi:GAF domain-containing protein
MIERDPVYFGLFLVALALLITGIVILVARFRGQITASDFVEFSPNTVLDLNEHDYAVMLIKHGGRLLFANRKTNEIFKLTKTELSLERLSQHTQPDGVFLGLCAAEGQARFTVNGRLIEGTSFALPSGVIGEDDRSILVTLRVPNISMDNAGQELFSINDLGIITAINQEMVASLELDEVIEAIFKSVKYLISLDYAQLMVLSASTEKPPNYFSLDIGLGAGRVDKSNLDECIDPRYSAYIRQSCAPLLIPDIESFRDIRPPPKKNRVPFNSYIGLPLILADELVGILEIASLSSNAFTQNDLEILQLLANQAAVVLHSARLFQDEQKRIRELSGLAKLAQAVGALGDQQDLFARLVESIAPLLDVEILGFLIYDDSRDHLSAQSPFLGVPNDFIPLYRILVTPESKAYSILSSNDVIVSTNPLNDIRLQELGITDMMQAISIRDTVFVPLTSVGGKLGYLQVANKKDGSHIDGDDVRLLTIISGQAATIIENSNLLHQSQERAQKAETLRRIAILTGSVATLDEVLTYAVHELAKLLKADIGMIMLLDENRAELNLHAPSIYGMSEINASQLWRISMSDPDYRSTVTGSQREVLSVNIDDATGTLPIYRSIINRLRLRSFIAVPIVIRQGGVGEILLGSGDEVFFDQNDLTMLVTAAGQLAGTLEKSILYTQTDETLRRRVEQLLAMTRVARELNTHLDLEHPLNLIYRELLSTTQSQCGKLILFNFDENSAEHLEVLVQLGEVSEESLSNVEQYVVNHDEPFTIHDYLHLDQNQVDSDIKPPHPDIRSSLIIPIRFREEVTGIIHLHSKDPRKYDDTALEIAQSLATQAAMALGNARRYQDQVQQTDLLRRRVETLEKLLEISGSIFPDQPIDKALEAIARGIQESTPFNVVVIDMFNRHDETVTTTGAAGLSSENLEQMRNDPRSWKSIEQLMKVDFRYGRTYFIPYDQKPIALPEFFPRVD